MEGTPFGRYRLVELLGRGGMGEVWRAYDSAINRVVALKVLPANFADDAVFQERFRREAQAAAGLDEPHVVPIFDFGEIEGRLFVTMRLIEGHDLQTTLANGPLAPGRAVGIIEQIAFALHAAHKVGLVHRDVKPSNILVAEHDFAYLIDFGIARTATETGLTATGVAIGTWSYMAPERFSTGEIDPRCDIYALACVLHQSLTGQLPYPGESLEQQIAGHMFAPPPQPSRLRPGIPAQMDAVIATGLAKDPAQRFSSTKELAAAAREALTPTRPLAPPATPARPPTRRAVEAPTPHIGVPRTDRAALGDTGAPPPSPTPQPGLRSPPASQPRPQAPVSPLVTERQRPWWRRKGVVIAAGLLIVAVIGAVMITVTSTSSPYGSQTNLPFTGLHSPAGVAVDAAGNVYVADSVNSRVVRLAGGTGPQTDLPFTGLNTPSGVAVDAAGNVYVTDVNNERVVRLAGGTGPQTDLPFTGLETPYGVAVDAAGNVYVTDGANRRVVRLAGGTGPQTDLPLTGLDSPHGVAVDAAGNVYVADFHSGRVVRVAGGTGPQTDLPFTGLDRLHDVAVDAAGNVYVTDYENRRVVRLAGGTGPQTDLPFTGLNGPTGVAVDAAGNVYVTDNVNNRVLKLPAR